jgi:hypothetical protein
METAYPKLSSYRSTRRHVPEGLNLQYHDCENVKLRNQDVPATLKFLTAVLLNNQSAVSSRSQRRKSYSWTSCPLKMGPIGCLETSVQNYHSTLRNTPEERRSHLNRGGSLKSRQNLCACSLRVPKYVIVLKEKSYSKE